MENEDLGVDIDEVISAINSAEVLVMRFPVIEKRLLLDFRTSSYEAPFLKVVNRVNSAEERFRDLRRLRPRFPAPERIVAMQWPRSVDVLVSSGVWPAIEQRMQSLNLSSAICQEVLVDLQREERLEAFRAIRGADNYETLWQRATR